MVPSRKSTQSGYPVSTADIPAMSNRICFTLIDSTITNCKKCKESRDLMQHKNAPIILASFLPTSPGAGRVCFRQNAYINSIGAGSLTRTGFNSQILGSTPKIRIERLGSTPRIRIEILGSTPKIHRFSRTILPSRWIIRSLVRNHPIFFDAQTAPISLATSFFPLPPVASRLCYRRAELTGTQGVHVDSKKSIKSFRSLRFHREMVKTYSPIHLEFLPSLSRWFWFRREMVVAN
jgi:hypothetical protein